MVVLKNHQNITEYLIPLTYTYLHRYTHVLTKQKYHPNNLHGWLHGWLTDDGCEQRLLTKTRQLTYFYVTNSAKTIKVCHYVLLLVKGNIYQTSQKHSLTKINHQRMSV